MALAAGLPLLLAGGSSSVGALTPNLPVFPNNLVVFPNRDFVTIEGFAEYQGKTGLVEVTRPGVGVVGSAEGEMSGEDVAFEVNHPGGYCWGEGTGLNVTPDIKAGDVVSLSIDGAVVAATTTLDVAADDAVQNGTTVVVTGRIGDGVISDNMEQRIIEPAMVDTSIARRDVRALPGPMVRSDKGGYSSELVFDEAADTFKATYVFDVLDEATIAAHAGLGERAMAWELVDEAGNRQGLTIAENGEPGGPGMGGCPNGPLQSGPPGPSKMEAVDVSGGIKVNWTPAVAIPGTPAILGYRVTAVSKLATSGEHVEIGRRITNPAANSTTLTGVASADYDVNVVSLSSVGETFPALPVAVKAPDATAPVVSASPEGGSYPVAQQVSLTANEFGADIYYTLDGNSPLVGDELSASAQHYEAPITISEETTLKFVAFDPSNNHSSVVSEHYTITNDPVAVAQPVRSASVGFGSVTLNWDIANPGVAGANITGYQIDVLASSDAASTPLRSVETDGDVTSVTIEGLNGDTPYYFTVRAKSDLNSAWGPASPVFGPVTPQGAVVADAGVDQSGISRNTVVTLSGAGSSSTPGTTYKWTQLVTGAPTRTEMPVGVDKVALTPSGTNASFTLPLYRFPMVNKPLTFELTVTFGDVVRTDVVVITPRSDTVSIGGGKWKQGDFRISGTSSTNGAIITVRSANGTTVGTAAVTAGAWELRLRNGAAPATNPGSVYADSNLGGTAGPFTVPNG